MKSRIIFTTGDSNGIGPEILLKIFGLPVIKRNFSVKITGIYSVFKYYSELLELPPVKQDDVIELRNFKNFKPEPGTIGKTSGKISGHSVRLAVELCLKKRFDAVVTMPVSKSALNKGGFKFNGHTEMISSQTGDKNYFMLMNSGNLNIIPLTIHIPLGKVAKSISTGFIVKKTIQINKYFKETFGKEIPKIAILSLNPHCGEDGILGSEESEKIIPALKILQAGGIIIKGPFASDGFFANKIYKDYDVILALYHDQAMIPFKILSYGKGVNLTGGIKIIRTSPSHGTGFDIAGKGKAKIDSTLAAVELADFLIKTKKRNGNHKG